MCRRAEPLHCDGGGISNSDELSGDTMCFTVVPDERDDRLGMVTIYSGLL